MSSNIPALIFDVAFALIAAIFIAVGVRRGFIKSLIQSAKFLLAIVITAFVAPIVSTFIKDTFLFQPIYDWLSEVGTNVATSTLPAFLRPEEGVIESTVSEGVLPYAEFVSNVASNVIGYIVTFVLALIVLSVLAWLLTAVTDRITFLGTANSILGGVFGCLMGLIVLFIIAIIVKTIDAAGMVYPDTFLVKFLGNLAP